MLNFTRSKVALHCFSHRRCAVKGLAIVIALVIASAPPSWAEELPKGTYSLKCWEGGVFAQVAYCTALFDRADEAR